jgi:hypothetical protein
VRRRKALRPKRQCHSFLELDVLKREAKELIGGKPAGERD